MPQTHPGVIKKNRKSLLTESRAQTVLITFGQFFVSGLSLCNVGLDECECVSTFNHAESEWM